MEKEIVLNCAYHYAEHPMIAQYDEELNIFYINIYLANGNFFKRLIKGIKYIFGFKSKYGNFTNIVWDEEILPKLEEISKTLKNKTTIPTCKGSYFVITARGNKTVLTFDPENKESVKFWNQHVDKWINSY